MANLLALPFARVTDANGDPVSGAKLFAYTTGTTTPVSTYTTSALTTAHANPVVADSGGLFPAIYLNPAVTYRFKVKTSAGVDISGMDFDPVSTATGASASVIDFGATGGGSVDDRAALQAAIDYVSEQGGGDLLVPPGTYRVVITDTVTDRGLVVAEDVSLQAKGAVFNIECTGDVYGLRLKSRAQIHGATVNVTSSTTPGSQSIWHSCISVGDAYGYGGTVGNVSSFHTASDWRIYDVILSNVRSGSGGVSAITMYGGVCNGVIDGVTVGDSSTMYGCIQMDWGFVGTITTSGSTAAEIAASIQTSRDNFDGGSAYTTHPHDIVIRNVRIGNMTAATGGALLGSIPVRISGAHNITVEDVVVEASTTAGFYFHAGDPGYEFAQAAVKPFRNKRVVVRNFTVNDANDGYGFWIDCDADNIATAVGEGYSPLLDPIQRADIELYNCHTYGSAGASAVAGFRIQEIIGCKVVNPLATGHEYGIRIEEGGDEVTIQGGFLFSNRKDGIYADNSSDKPQNFTVDSARVYQNNTSAGSFANIRTLSADNVTVRRCLIGRASETATWAFRCESTTTGLVMEDNYVEAGAIGYSIGSSTDYGILRTFRNNGAAAAVVTPYAGVNIVTEGTDEAGRKTGRAAKASLTTEITPASGTWVAGSTIHYTDPAAAGYRGTSCVTGGTPGTWRRFGVHEA